MWCSGPYSTGYVEVLPTAAGAILRDLFRAGSKLGLASRVGPVLNSS